MAEICLVGADAVESGTGVAAIKRKQEVVLADPAPASSLPPLGELVECAGLALVRHR